MRKPLAATALLLSTVLLNACGTRPATAPVASAPVAPEPKPTAPGPAAGTDPAKPGVPVPPVPEMPASPAPEVPKPVRRTMPEHVRGLHVSGWFAGSPDLLGPLLTWAKEAGLNTVVLDVKAEDGKMSWNSEVPLAKEIGANTPKIRDIEKLVRELHERGFWVVGRIVVMNDSFLYRARPELRIPGFDGGAYSFLDPKQEGVWRYNLDIAKESVKVGMDEIQFDYIRYPEKLVSGYNKDTDAAYRTSHINGFLKKAMEELKPLGAVVSADIFGLTTSVPDGDDMEIGQDYRQVAEIVDFVSPMIYPSHYAKGTYGIANPDASPYQTVKSSMEKALERTQGIPVAKHRPWIQDFTYPAQGAHPYGPSEVTAQVKALRELGIDSFLLWDPRNKYSRGIDYNKPPQ